MPPPAVLSLPEPSVNFFSRPDTKKIFFCVVFCVCGWKSTWPLLLRPPPSWHTPRSNSSAPRAPRQDRGQSNAHTCLSGARPAFLSWGAAADTSQRSSHRSQPVQPPAVQTQPQRQPVSAGASYTDPPATFPTALSARKRTSANSVVNKCVFASASPTGLSLSCALCQILGRQKPKFFFGFWFFQQTAPPSPAQPRYGAADAYSRATSSKVGALPYNALNVFSRFTWRTHSGSVQTYATTGARGAVAVHLRHTEHCRCVSCARADACAASISARAAVRSSSVLADRMRFPAAHDNRVCSMKSSNPRLRSICSEHRKPGSQQMRLCKCLPHRLFPVWALCQLFHSQNGTVCPDENAFSPVQLFAPGPATTDRNQNFFCFLVFGFCGQLPLPLPSLPPHGSTPTRSCSRSRCRSQRQRSQGSCRQSPCRRQ